VPAGDFCPTSVGIRWNSAGGAKVIMFIDDENEDCYQSVNLSGGGGRPT
jgi:hypothetical protein